MRTYRFTDNPTCRMCGAGPPAHRVVGQRLDRSQGFRPAALNGVSVAVQKCTRCALLSPNPIPEPENLSDHYGTPPENYWAKVKMEETGFPLEREVVRAKSLLPARENMRALDVGAGLGRVLETLEQHGFEAHGLEPSKPFHDHILQTTSLPPDRIALSTLEDASYPGASFDFITFGAVLEHLYDPGLALEKAFGWLKPGGIIHAEVPSSAYLMARLLNVYFRLRGTNFVTNISPMHSPFHIYEFELDSFEQHGRKCGYSVACHDRIVGTIYHLPNWLDYPFRQWMELTGTGMQLVVFLRKEDAPTGQ